MRYLTRQYGAEGRLAWLKQLAAGDSIDEATQGALRLSFADLDVALAGQPERAAGRRVVGGAAVPLRGRYRAHEESGGAGELAIGALV